MDAPLVTIIERDERFEIATSENGFQGHGIVRGLLEGEAEAVASALLSALTAKGLREIDAKIASAPREGLEHEDWYVEALRTKRNDFLARARIVRDRRAS